MKKIYSLLLLGAFMLLGAQSAWGTWYVHHNGAIDGSNTWGDAEMTEINGMHSVVFRNVKSGSVSFKVWDKNSTWKSNYSGDGSNISLGGGGSNDITFTSTAGTDVKIIFDGNNNITVNTVYQVDVYSSIEVSKLYVWFTNNSDFPQNGGWPGNGKTSDVTVSKHGQNWYKYSFDFPSGKMMKLIFNNGSGVKTGDLTTFNISANTCFYYTVVNNTTSYTASHTFPYLLGGFNSWGGDDVFVDGLATVNIESAGTYDFKVWDGSNWYGWGTGSSKYTYGSSSTKDLYAGDNNLGITMTVEGDYVFGYNDEIHYLSVMFPGSYAREASAGQWGTICLPYASTAEEGATFYSIVNLREENSTSYLVLEEVEGHLVAGKPYIFEASGNISITCGTTASAATSDNGLIGGYYKRSVPENMYVIVNEGSLGKVKKVISGGEGVKCDAARAYIDLSAITPVTPAPGRRIVEMPLAPETATNIGNIEANEKAVKFFENGQLFIQKNGVVYDMTGRAVK